VAYSHLLAKTAEEIEGVLGKIDHRTARALPYTTLRPEADDPINEKIKEVEKLCDMSLRNLRLVRQHLASSTPADAFDALMEAFVYLDSAMQVLNELETMT
jgi:hypothetical protein